MGILASSATSMAQEETPEAVHSVAQFTTKWCTDCHSGATPSSGFSLDQATLVPIGQSADTWERVVRKLGSRQMPPLDSDRPSEAEYTKIITLLETTLDRHATSHPNPGRTETFRRLTRYEYQNTVRDLLKLDMDVTEMLPEDESSHGFDNVTVGELSPSLMNRYVLAAEKIASLSTGSTGNSMIAETFRVRPDLTQEERLPELPFGTRGGIDVPYPFPATGDYDIEVRLMRDRNEHVEGLNRPHDLMILLDRRRVAVFTVHPPKNQGGHQTADQHLKARIRIQAGPHNIAATFLKMPSSIPQTKRQPLDAHFNFHRHPRLSPAVYSLSFTGPLAEDNTAPTPAWTPVLTCTPTSEAELDNCARQVLSPLLRRAYRRPVTESDFKEPMRFFTEAVSANPDSDLATRFSSGIESAVAAMLVNPNFLFRIEREPLGATAGDVFRISDLELATRLSYFLWSSAPDETLLELAERDELRRPHVLRQQVNRLLADERANAIVSNFASQWLYLRNLNSITPDARLFPDFDHNLRVAFQRETEMLFEQMMREDRSVLHLLQTNQTFLNERLARHYGIDHVQGSHFRPVNLPPESHRGGILRHGSILTVTSYATRTSPVIRGHWILKNLLGTPPPPPPDNIPALTENNVSSTLTVRERLEAHRADRSCAVCHDMMDPLGFALENFDAVGRWQSSDEDIPIDATGQLPDGRTINGVEALEEGLLSRPEAFVRTITEKLMVYALGRGLQTSDSPFVRDIVRNAAVNDFRFSSVIIGIVESPPFQMRTAR
ncbi:MAG: DUF1592 domain-containing protein [Planctomycetaceae bacterium]